MFYINPYNNKKESKIFEGQRRRKSENSSSQISSDDNKSVFKAKLEDTIVEETNKDLELLLENIEKASIILYNETSIGNLNKYKDTVKKFLRFSSKNIFAITTLRGRRVDYKILRILDEKLKYITENFFYLQKDRLSLLSEIDEIKGLVINVIY